MSNFLLCNCSKMDINYNNTPFFSSRDNQINWFIKKAIYRIEEGTYFRKNTDLKVRYNIEHLKLCNYAITKNDDESRYEFYFIADKQYVNENTTLLVLRMDLIQTYLFEFELGNCLIERLHTRRKDSKGKPFLQPYKIEENYTAGEYVVKGKYDVYNYLGKGGYIITSSDLLGTKSGGSATGGSGSLDIGSYPYNSLISLERNNRLSKIWKGVKEAQKYGLFPSVTYAQYIIESGWEGSTLSNKYNNAFGIKADSSWTGERVALSTWEDYGNGRVEIVDYFRVYDDINQSVRDRVQFLLNNSNYVNGGVFSAKTYAEQCQALKNSGYATDPLYASKLIEIIESNGFTTYDSISIDIRENIVNSARKLIGVPYIYGGNYPPLGNDKGTDCSGLIQWAYNDNAMRTTRTTYTQINEGKNITLDNLQPGDLVFSRFSSPGVPEHVFMFSKKENEKYYCIEAQQPGTYISEHEFIPNSSMVFTSLL